MYPELPQEKVVGARGFEPPTPWSRTRCATRLRYAPNSESRCCDPACDQTGEQGNIRRVQPLKMGCQGSSLTRLSLAEFRGAQLLAAKKTDETDLSEMGEMGGIDEDKRR